ncbi:GGDEF domain-containing protein [Vibrio ponticus]|uniref:diguanylate cyclase n=2 Tax=Vibrio ponticus TaxID=265668 RepID=A0A3N3E0P0_9VIBR|nr:GGDEF domain-containing protein [Vibrio ponticus]
MSRKREFWDVYMVDSIRTAILIVVVFSLLNVAHYYMNLRVFRDNLVDTTLYRTTNYITRTLNDVNQTYAYASHVLAGVYASKLQEGYSTSDMLTELKQTKKMLSVKNVGLVDIRKNLYVDSFGSVLTLDITSDRDKWIQEFVNKPIEYRYNFYDPDEVEYDALYSFFHDHKIKDNNGEVIGIFGIGIDYEAFYERIKGLDDNIFVSFVTLGGEVRLPKNVKGESIFNLFPTMTSERFQSSSHEDQIFWQYDDSQTFLVYFHYLQDINRVLLLKLDVSEYYNESKIQHFYSFLLGLAVTVLVVFANLALSIFQNKQLKHSAFYDSLTQCRNRNYLENQIKKSSYWQFIKQNGYSMIAFDIDYFKNINDSYGHAEGDRVLKQVAEIVKSSLRETDEFLRLGGDEFLILLNLNAKQTLSIANRINQHVVKETMVSLSIGITEVIDQDSFESAMERADSALYQAKNNGRNQVAVRWVDNVQ